MCEICNRERGIVIDIRERKRERTRNKLLLYFLTTTFCQNQAVEGIKKSNEIGINQLGPALSRNCLKIEKPQQFFLCFINTALFYGQVGKLSTKMWGSTGTPSTSMVPIVWRPLYLMNILRVGCR